MASIMIIAGDGHVSEAASTILIGAGHSCARATVGARALILLRWRIPDLILLDDEMPEVSGSTILQILRRNPKFCDIPVLILRSISAHRDGPRETSSASSEFVSKPIEKSALVIRVNQILKSLKSQSASVKPDTGSQTDVPPIETAAQSTVA